LDVIPQRLPFTLLRSYGSNAKMRFQSFFMLTTIQLLFLTSWFFQKHRGHNLSMTEIRRAANSQARNGRPRLKGAR
jgi:hypothetical protein